MTKKKIKVEFKGSKFWVIFWTLLFFPIAMILLLTQGQFSTESKTYSFSYEGSVFWLGFWTIFFFPIAFLLLFLNGFSMIEKSR